MAAGSAKLCVRSTQDDSQAQHDAINGGTNNGAKEQIQPLPCREPIPGSLAGQDHSRRCKIEVPG